MCLVALSGSGAGDHVTRMRTASKLKGLKRTSQRGDQYILQANLCAFRPSIDAKKYRHV